MVATGYSVRTDEGLRRFRDTTLGDAAGDLAQLQQMITDARIPSGAWPAVASAAQSGHLSAIDAMAEKAQQLTSLNDRHIDGVTATAANYGLAEESNVAVVTGRSVTGPADTGANPARPIRAGSAPTASVPAACDVDPQTVIAVYQRLEKLSEPFGIAGLIHPICQTVAANVRDPAPFRLSAAQSEQIAKAADQLKNRVSAGFTSLDSQWTGQAHDSHGTVAGDYETHLTTISGAAMQHAAAALQQADAQNHANTGSLIIGSIAATFFALIGARSVYAAIMYSTTMTDVWIAVIGAIIMFMCAALTMLGATGAVPSLWRRT